MDFVNRIRPYVGRCHVDGELCYIERTIRTPNTVDRPPYCPLHQEDLEDPPSGQETAILMAAESAYQQGKALYVYEEDGRHFAVITENHPNDRPANLGIGQTMAEAANDALEWHRREPKPIAPATSTGRLTGSGWVVQWAVPDDPDLPYLLRGWQQGILDMVRHGPPELLIDE